jgi:hypothetical protein
MRTEIVATAARLVIGLAVFSIFLGVINGMPCDADLEQWWNSGAQVDPADVAKHIRCGCSYCGMHPYFNDDFVGNAFNSIETWLAQMGASFWRAFVALPFGRWLAAALAAAADAWLARSFCGSWPGAASGSP